MHCRNVFIIFLDINSLFLSKDPDKVPEDVPLIILDSKSAFCMARNGKDNKHTSHIARRVHFIRNGEK